MPKLWSAYETGSRILVTLEVAREVPPNGYFLSDGYQDVLLPYAEIVGKIKPGEHVEAFYSMIRRTG